MCSTCPLTHCTCYTSPHAAVSKFPCSFGIRLVFNSVFARTEKCFALNIEFADSSNEFIRFSFMGEPFNFKDRDIFTISTRVQGFFAFVSKCIQNANIQFLAKDDIVYTYWANAHFNRKAHSHAWTSMCISSAIGVHGWFISFYSPLNLRFGFMANVRRKGIENTNWIRASRFC